MLYQYKFFRYKYPKLTLLVMCTIVAYFLYMHGFFDTLTSVLSGQGLFSVFFAGILFAFGFTAPFAVAFFIALNPSSIIMTAVVGGLGTLMGDLFIFQFIKISFMNEFTKLEREKILRKAENIFWKGFHGRIGHYLLIVLVGFIIASPLPNEIGLAMLAGLTKINHYLLAVLSFVLGMLGILALLMI